MGPKAFYLAVFTFCGASGIFSTLLESRRSTSRVRELRIALSRSLRNFGTTFAGGGRLCYCAQLDPSGTDLVAVSRGTRAWPGCGALRIPCQPGRSAPSLTRWAYCVGVSPRVTALSSGDIAPKGSRGASAEKNCGPSPRHWRRGRASLKGSWRSVESTTNRQCELWRGPLP